MLSVSQVNVIPTTGGKATTTPTPTIAQPLQVYVHPCEICDHYGAELVSGIDFPCANALAGLDVCHVCAKLTF